MRKMRRLHKKLLLEILALDFGHITQLDFKYFMKRKEFLKQAGALVTITVMGGLSSCSDDLPEPGLDMEVTIDLNQVPFDILTTEGNWVLHPDENIILVNWQGEIRAFTSVCTHSQCSRAWVFGGAEATCTCHGSKFDWKGSVIQGPAKSDLVNFNIAADGNLLTIS